MNWQGVQLALWVCLTAAAGPVLAQGQTRVALCGDTGCTCTQSPLSSDEILFIAGDTSSADRPVDPATDILVYEPDLGLLSWVDASPDTIHRQFGGQGACPVMPQGAADPAAPLDGAWQWRTLGESTSGCPALLGGMLATSRVDYIQTDVIWDAGFDPALLDASLPKAEIAGVTPYKWRKVGPDRWLSDNVQSRSCADGACTEVAVTLSMTLVAPDRISGLFSLRSRIDGAQAAIMAGFGMAECQVRARYDITRVGP